MTGYTNIKAILIAFLLSTFVLTWTTDAEKDRVLQL